MRAKRRAEARGCGVAYDGRHIRNISADDDESTCSGTRSSTKLRSSGGAYVYMYICVFVCV